jgi:hypothetical protein
MLVAEEFVFVHIPKTGGTFVRRCITDTVPVVAEFDAHSFYRNLPEEFKDRPAICFRRNPWDWYVSEWEYNKQTKGATESFPDYLARRFARTPDLYSRMFRQIAGIGGIREGRVEVGEFARLREDFVAFLDRHGIEAPGLRETVMSAPPENVSERSGYRSYYDEETRALVGSSTLAKRYEF